MYRRAGVNRAMGPSWESTWLPRRGARPNPPQVMVATMLTRRKMLRRGTVDPPERVGTVLVGSRGSGPVDGADRRVCRGALRRLDAWLDGRGLRRLEPRPANGSWSTTVSRPQPCREHDGQLTRLLQAAVGHPRVAVAELPQMGRSSSTRAPGAGSPSKRMATCAPHRTGGDRTSSSYCGPRCSRCAPRGPRVDIDDEPAVRRWRLGRGGDLVGRHPASQPVSDEGRLVLDGAAAWVEHFHRSARICRQVEGPVRSGSGPPRRPSEGRTARPPHTRRRTRSGSRVTCGRAGGRVRRTTDSRRQRPRRRRRMASTRPPKTYSPSTSREACSGWGAELSFLGATLHVSTHAPSTCTAAGGSGPERRERAPPPRRRNRRRGRGRTPGLLPAASRPHA